MITQRPWWPWARRVVTAGFFCVVAWLLVDYFHDIQWRAVWTNLQALPLWAVFVAAGFTAISYAIFSCFDLFGRHYTQHGLRRRQSMLVNFISYAFNLNFGATVGGVAFRYRLYSQLGLGNATITRVMVMSVLTNWLGYLLLLGTLLLVLPPTLPEGWKLGEDALPYLGSGLLLAAAAYIVTCMTMAGRVWHVRGHAIKVPEGRMAVMQAVMSVANWSMLGLVLFTLLQGRIPLTDIITALMMAAGAGLFLRVPAGIGVLEAVVLGLLSPQLPKDELLAALLTYRGVYYLLPLAIAAVTYAVVEAHVKSAKLKAEAAINAADKTKPGIKPGHASQAKPVQNLYA